MVTLRLIRSATLQAFKEDALAIHAHIAAQEAQGRSGGIEHVFANALNRQLEEAGLTVKPERDAAELGCRILTGNSIRGQIDATFERHGKILACAEYKAARMPRRGNSPLFILGQLAADYHRMRTAMKAPGTYMAVFVYGPLVGDSSSDGDLWRRFHNQQFIEFQSCLPNGLGDFARGNRAAAKALGWNAVCTEARIPAHGSVARHDGLGAVIFHLRGGLCP